MRAGRKKSAKPRVPATTTRPIAHFPTHQVFFLAVNSQQPALVAYKSVRIPPVSETTARTTVQACLLRRRGFILSNRRVECTHYISAYQSTGESPEGCIHKKSTSLSDPVSWHQISVKSGEIRGSGGHQGGIAEPLRVFLNHSCQFPEDDH